MPYRQLNKISLAQHKEKRPTSANLYLSGIQAENRIAIPRGCGLVAANKAARAAPCEYPARITLSDPIMALSLLMIRLMY